MGAAGLSGCHAPVLALAEATTVHRVATEATLTGYDSDQLHGAGDTAFVVVDSLTHAGIEAYHSPMRGSSHQTRLLAIPLLLSVSVNGAWAQRHERKRVERAEVLAMESEWRRAQLSEDIPEMDRLLSDNFLGITAAGQVVTKTQQLDRMRSRQIAISKLDMADTKIKISGNLAVVTSLARLDGMSNGAPLHGSFRYTRVYQRASGAGWKITNFEATRVPSDTALLDLRISSPQASAAAPSVASPSSLPASRVEPSSPRPQS